jgi:hypothetical protein
MADDLTPRIADRARIAAIAEADAVLAANTPNTRQRIGEALLEAYIEIDRLRQRLADAGIADA